MTKTTTLPPHFLRTLTALRMAAPIALASRYEDGLRYCVQASVCGAAALRRRKIDAQPVPCAVVAEQGDGENVLTIGWSPRQLYDKATDGRPPPIPSFEEWKATVASGIPDEEAPFHEVIRARFGGASAIVDLTLGQLRSTGAPEAETLPLALIVAGAGWPSADGGGWSFRYFECPHPPDVVNTHNASVKQLVMPGFVDDLDGLMALALHVKLNADAFMAELHRQQPEMLATAVGRLRRSGRS